MAQVSTLVTVVVTDINDNKPEFYNCSLASCNFSTSAQNNFRGNIIEHSSSRLPVSDLSIVTYDPDKVGACPGGWAGVQTAVLAAPPPSLLHVSPWQGTNSSYELYLQGPDASAFTVSPTKIVGTGEVQLLVQDPLSVDYEKSHVMVVQVRCGDSPCSLHMPGHRGDPARLLRGSKAKAEHGSALAACFVQRNWAGV